VDPDQPAVEHDPAGECGGRVTLERWLAFVATSVVVLVVPGPTILTMTSYVMAYGRRSRALLVAAVALADLTAISASLLGVGALLAASTTIFTIVKWAGAVYIFYLGVAQLCRRAVLHTTRAEVTMARGQLFGRMFVVTLLNPKGVIFYVAFLPQFVGPEGEAFGQLLVLAVTFATLAAINAWTYAAAASLVSTRLASGAAPRIFNVVSGALLVCAAAWTMTTTPTSR
jgi:threonine/homoserine/homoserine lactone efflux protein